MLNVCSKTDFKTIPTLFFESFLSIPLDFFAIVINALEMKFYCFLCSLFLELLIYFSWINFSFDIVHPGVPLVGMGKNDFFFASALNDGLVRDKVLSSKYVPRVLFS